MAYDPKRVKKQIESEANLYSKFGPGNIWEFILREIFNNDIKSAKKFMVSSDGGFSTYEVNKLMQRKQTNRNYNKKASCGMDLSINS